MSRQIEKKIHLNLSRILDLKREHQDLLTKQVWIPSEDGSLYERVMVIKREIKRLRKENEEFWEVWENS